MLTFDFNKIDLMDNSGKMLDVGCGEGRHVFGLMQKFPNLHCTGLDLHGDSLKKSQEGYEFFKSISNAGAEFIKGSVYSLPFPDNSFDLVVCSEVLEHLHEYKDAIVEINRVLKPGGSFLASVPTAWPEKICWALSTEYQNQPGGHLRIFKQSNLVNEISERGFSFVQSEKFHSIHSPYWWLRCLFWKNQETNILIRVYKKFLETHILKKPLWIDLIDKSLNPIMGKSTAMYFTKKMNWVDLHDRLLPAKNWIVQNQLLDGSIPWDEKGKCDAWDHSECLISLAIYEEWDAFEKGVDWFFSNLNSKGLIYSEFNNQQPTQLNYQSHHAPYIALPLLQRYLIDKNPDHLNKYLPQLTTIFSSLLDFMDTDGMYYWSKDDNGYSDNSLITASMSIAISAQAYTSIIEILDLVNENSNYDSDLKSKSLKDLKTLLNSSFWSNSEIPWDRFDRDGVDRSRFSMDFFYQSLARVNLDKDFFKSNLKNFYEQDLGIKCVAEEPWITIAETSECIIATYLNYDKSLAIKMFEDILKFQNPDGIFPTGYQYKLDILWPNEQSTWTNAALIIAANVIYGTNDNIFTF